MVKLPGTLTAESFLARYWQKDYLFMPAALPRLRPSVSRNELAWLATLEDVESRIVYTRRGEDAVRYVAETGPFDTDYLANLPRRDWTLLVHDVEKHLPPLRRLFAHVPFIPDWRIDDLMVSFAAPGGGVGPHRDNYDVFLCQGIGVREWHVTDEDVADDPAASDDLALLETFDGIDFEVREGDVLYLPPGVAHWGTALRACITYSIGMRAPQFSDLSDALPDIERENPFYADADLATSESLPGYISPESTRRAMRLLGTGEDKHDKVAEALGRSATETKDWISPETIADDEAAAVISAMRQGVGLKVHGMARIAYDERNLFANGRSMRLATNARPLIEDLCATRKISDPRRAVRHYPEIFTWLVKMGAFEIPETL